MMAILLVGVAIVCYGAHKQQSTDDLMRKCEQARSISDYNSLDNLSKQLIDKGNKSGNRAQGGLSVADGCRCLTKELDMIAC